MSMPLPLPSTFMPLPLAIMIPFMGIQSAVMARQFGMGFQYGKRKISSMSNEEFNKLTPQQMQIDFAREIKDMIPTFGESLKDMRPFQRMIWVEMLAVMKEAIELGIDVAKAGVDPLAHIFGQHIHGEGPGSGPPPFVDPHKFLSPAQILEHKRHGHLGGTGTSPPPDVESPPPYVDPPDIPPAVDDVFRFVNVELYSLSWPNPPGKILFKGYLQQIDLLRLRHFYILKRNDPKSSAALKAKMNLNKLVLNSIIGRWTSLKPK